MWQSCAHARIECGNPVPTPGLTAGRVSGEKTLCQRYCEDSIASGGFFGQNRKLKRSRKTDLGVERSRNPDLGKKNPDLGAGSDAGQARPGGYARQECGALGVGRARIGRAIKRGWGEPSNEVRASHQTRLGEPVLKGRWASQC